MAAQSPAECPIATRVCREIVSLPLHPGLDERAIDEVARAVRRR